MGFIFSKNRKQVQNTITFGNATFAMDEKDYEMIQKIDQNNYFILFKPDWNIQYMEFVKENWSQVFSHMRDSYVQRLALYKCGSTNILQQIQHVKFHNLELLSLGMNKIQSIEGLSFLHLEKLKTLRLNENKITKLGPLSKLNCPNLQTLIICQNPIVLIDKVQRIRLNSHLQKSIAKNRLAVQIYHVSGYCQDISFLMKIELNFVENFGIEAKQMKKKHLEAFFRKFPK